MKEVQLKLTKNLCHISIEDMRIKLGFKNILTILLMGFLFVSLPVYLSAGKTVSKGDVENPQNGPSAYTLDRLIALAKQKNLSVKISELDRKIAVESYRDSRALDNPEGEYSQGNATAPEVTGNTKIWGWGVKWALPNPLHRYYYLKSLRADITEAGIQAEINNREVIKTLKFHYYKLLLFSKLKTSSEERLRILTEVASITKAKVDIGESKEIDYLRSTVEMQKINTELFRIEKNLAYERNQINELLDFVLPLDFKIEDELNNTADFVPMGELKTGIETMAGNSPIVRLESNRVEKGRSQLRAARFSIIESVELFGERAKEIDGKTWRLGLGISIPLFNQKTAAVRLANFEKQKAQLEYDQARKHVTGEIRQMIDEIRVLEKEIETLKNAIVKESKENMDITEKLYKEGEIALMVFLDSQKNFFEMQDRFYEAITEWNILNAELETLLGGN